MHYPLLILLLCSRGVFRRGARRVFLIVAAVPICLALAACSTPESNNSNTTISYDNTNSAANMSNSMSNTSNSMANTGHIDITSSLTPMALTAALKVRLKSDAGSELAKPDWDADRWLEVPIGRFYGNDDEFAKDAVCRAIDDALGKARRRLAGTPRLNLRKLIDRKTMCRLAVAAMRDASLESEPIDKIP